MCLISPKDWRTYHYYDISGTKKVQIDQLRREIMETESAFCYICATPCTAMELLLMDTSAFRIRM